MNAPDRYRKKPVVIDAIQWTGDNLNAVLAFCVGDAAYELMARGNAELVISTLEDGEGTAKHVASRGDYIIKGVKGEFYPCKPDIFAATYEPADLARAPLAAAIREAAAVVEREIELAKWLTPMDVPILRGVHRNILALIAKGAAE